MEDDFLKNYGKRIFKFENSEVKKEELIDTTTTYPKLTFADIKEYQDKMKIIKKNGFRADEFKALGRDLRDKFGLKDIEAINILNGVAEEILKILANQEGIKLD